METLGWPRAHPKSRSAAMGTGKPALGSPASSKARTQEHGWVNASFQHLLLPLKSSLQLRSDGCPLLPEQPVSTHCRASAWDMEATVGLRAEPDPPPRPAVPQKLPPHQHQQHLLFLLHTPVWPRGLRRAGECGGPDPITNPSSPSQQVRWDFNPAPPWSKALSERNANPLTVCMDLSWLSSFSSHLLLEMGMEKLEHLPPKGANIFSYILVFLSAVALNAQVFLAIIIPRGHPACPFLSRQLSIEGGMALLLHTSTRTQAWEGPASMVTSSHDQESSCRSLHPIQEHLSDRVGYDIVPKLSMGRVKPNYLLHRPQVFIKASNAGSPRRVLLQGRLWRLDFLLVVVSLSLSILPALRCRLLPPTRAVGSITAGNIHPWGWAPPATAPMSLQPRWNLIPAFLHQESASYTLPQGVLPLLLILKAV